MNFTIFSFTKTLTYASEWYIYASENKAIICLDNAVLPAHCKPLSEAKLADYQLDLCKLTSVKFNQN